MAYNPHHSTDAADMVSLAKAKTVGFEDIDTGTGGFATVENGYAKLDWSNFYCVDPVKFDLDPNSGYFADLTGKQDAFTGLGDPGTISLSGGSFNANSVDVAAAWDTKLKIEIVGFKGGEQVYDMKVTIDDKGPTHLDLGFKGIDTLEFISLKGKPDTKLEGSGDQIVFDQFDFSKIKGGDSAAPAEHKAVLSAFAAAGVHGHTDAGHLAVHADAQHVLALA